MSDSFTGEFTITGSNLIGRMTYPVQIKKLKPEAVIPEYQTSFAAGVDLRACIDEPIEVQPGQKSILIGTGIAIFQNNPNMVAMIYPRSGMGHKNGLVLGNGTGVIDADYQGELMVSACVRVGHTSVVIHPGDRIAQLVFLPVLSAGFREVEEFEASQRGTGGFGSTGV